MDALSKKARIAKLKEALAAAESLIEDGGEEEMTRLRSEIIALLDPQLVSIEQISIALKTVEALDPAGQDSEKRERILRNHLRDCPYCGSPCYYLIQDAAIDCIVVRGIRGHFKVDVVMCKGCGHVDLFSTDLHEYYGNYHLYSESVKRLTTTNEKSPYR